MAYVASTGSMVSYKEYVRRPLSSVRRVCSSICQGDWRTSRYISARILTVVLASRLRCSACCWSTELLPSDSLFIWHRCCIIYYRSCSLLKSRIQANDSELISFRADWSRPVYLCLTTFGDYSLYSGHSRNVLWRLELNRMEWSVNMSSYRNAGSFS